jgi:hypothetical protein
VMLETARERGFHPKTVGADKGYDTRACVAEVRALGVTPHVARNVSANRSSAIDGRTTRHPGYAISQRKRKLVEEVFGWMKTVGGVPADALPGVSANPARGLPGANC